MAKRSLIGRMVGLFRSDGPTADTAESRHDVGPTPEQIEEARLRDWADTAPEREIERYYEWIEEQDAAMWREEDTIVTPERIDSELPPPERIEAAFEQVDAVLSRHYTKRDGRYPTLFDHDLDASRWDEDKRVKLLEENVSWEGFGLQQAEAVIYSAAQGRDFRTEIAADDYEALRIAALALVEYEFDHLVSNHQDPDYEPVDSWYPLPEAEKLAGIYQKTSVAQLSDDQAREFLGREVKFDQIPVAEQKRVMGETWERFAPAESIQRHDYQPSETAIRPLQRVRADSPELNIQKPLTM